MSLLDEFHFLRPAWLLLLGLLPLLGWAWRRAARSGNPWRRVVDPHLLPALLEPGSAGGRQSRALPLLLLALLLGTLALAGPAWRPQAQPLLRSEAGLIVALDLSSRMRAADLAPDRLTRARFKLADLLRRHRDGQIALIAYAGDAFTVAPLTTDAATLEALLSALETELMPVPGQRADRAIELAAELAGNAGLGAAQLLLLTDDADARAVDAAQRARAGGLRTSVLGVGTAQGAPVPLPGGSFATDAAGRPLLAARQDDALARLAAAGGGRYQPMTADDGDLRRLALDELAAGARIEDGSATLARYHDDGAWLLVLLLPLAALGFRRGWLGCLPLLLVLAPEPAQAIEFEALWRRADQRAHRALEQGELERARALARDAGTRGSIEYRDHDYAAAARAFAEADGADAHYNRGNALARAGRFEDALQAYDAALARQPGMDDAVHNRELVEQALRQQQQQQQQQQQGPQQQPQPGGEGEDGEPGEPQDEAADGEPQPGDGEDGEPQPQPGEDREPGDDAGGNDGDPDDGASPPDAEQQRALAEAIDQALDDPAGESPAAADYDIAEDEHAQAAEQRLRRIPDDPGGLLRRKFALEHRRRLSEGQGED
jgi:Ca-activated chloride channel homolog